MKADLGQDSPDYNAFTALRKAEFKHIKCKQYKVFAKCNECTAIQDKIDEKGSDPAVKKMWHVRLQQHLEWMRGERNKKIYNVSLHKRHILIMAA